MSKWNFKIALAGDGAVGKTSIRERYMGKGFSSSYLKTIGADFATKKITIDENQITFQIWDLAGQQRFEFVRATFYRGSHGIIMVFDVTNPTSFVNLREWSYEILQNLGNRNLPLPIVLLGNKSDLQTKQLISQDSISTFREELKLEFQSDSIPFLYTSALSGMNIEEAFEVLGHLLLSKQKVRQSSKHEIVKGKISQL